MHTPTARDIVEGSATGWRGVNRLMTRVAEGYAEAGTGIERIASRDGRADHLAMPVLTSSI
jgi:hypothetical protein